jgi:hypothetical protein
MGMNRSLTQCQRLQQVSHGIENPRVPGSIPGSGTKIQKTQPYGWVFAFGAGSAVSQHRRPQIVIQRKTIPFPNHLTGGR